MTTALELNRRAAALCAQLLRSPKELCIARHTTASGTTLFDFGIEALGGIDAGLLLARVCLADLATVHLNPAGSPLRDWPSVVVATKNPVAACMASQYAGWELKGDRFFAMGSGPMRAAAGREPLFESIGHRETAVACVGVLEASQLPHEKICQEIARKCGIQPSQLTLLVAPTCSLAGTLQVVARSVETVLHKLHELGFDLSRVVKGVGTAPLPAVAKNDLAAIGATNDAILYGGQVTLEVTGDDHSIEQLGPHVPSTASSDYGKPFSDVMAKYHNDFYQIDPLLFSAAQVTFNNVNTGSQFVFGELNYEILMQSLGSA